MMNKFKKGFLVAMALTMAGSTLLAGCGGGTSESGSKDYGNKSVLYVDNYAGGFGKEWLDNVIERFEAEYANYSFESGKTGVVVEVDHNKNQGETYIPLVDAKPAEVYFPGNIYYHTWINAGKMMDITDVVTGVGASETVSAIIENDGGKTILSKMTDEEKTFYKVDDKYHAIPHHNSIPGIVYDIDLFETKSLYIAQGGGYTNSNGQRSNGPDGKPGTSDDGLPATYEEFYALCDYMTTPAVGVTPFIWMGNNKIQYTNMMLTALMTDYEGVEQTKLNYTFDGTATNLISVVADGTVTELPDTEITSETGYKVYQNAGRYYALKFFETILDDPSNLHSACEAASLEDTHNAYLMSTQDTSPVAFMPEGNWWENESTAVFKRMEQRLDPMYSKTNRKFGFLPLPKATADKVGEETTYAVSEVSLGFIKSTTKAEKVNLAKTFLAYCYTDESLNEFTKTVGLPAALQYEVEEETYNGLSAYGKSQCDIKVENLVKPYSTNSIYNINNAQLNIEYTFRVDVSKNAITRLLAGDSAETHFNNLCNNRFTAAAWAGYLN